MKIKTTKLKLLFFSAILIALSQHTIAKDFNITTDFSHPANEDGAGGGGCAGTLIVQKIVQRKESLLKIGKIYAGQAFIEDTLCDVEDRIVISINNTAFVVSADSKKYEYKNGFLSSYSNEEAKLRIKITHLKTLRAHLNKDTDCVSYIRKVRVDIEFEGVRKKIYGIVNGGCP